MSDNVSSAWHADFFTELPNEFWRRAVPPAAAEAEADFIEERLGLAPGSRIVDVPCGSGRHSIALARRGYRVTGLDISQEAISHASKAADGLGAEFLVADMRDVPRTGEFDAALCMGNSFGYLDIEGTREFVAGLAGAVRPGGGLVVDFNVAAESVLPGFKGEPRTLETGDISVLATTEYDVAGSRLLSTYHFTQGAREFRATAIHHVFTSAHIGQLLTDAGFTDIERFSGPAGDPYELGSGGLLLTARRKA